MATRRPSGPLQGRQHPSTTPTNINGQLSMNYRNSASRVSSSSTLASSLSGSERSSELSDAKQQLYQSIMGGGSTRARTSDVYSSPSMTSSDRMNAPSNIPMSLTASLSRSRVYSATSKSTISSNQHQRPPPPSPPPILNPIPLTSMLTPSGSLTSVPSLSTSSSLRRRPMPIPQSHVAHLNSLSRPKQLEIPFPSATTSSQHHPDQFSTKLNGKPCNSHPSASTSTPFSSLHSLLLAARGPPASSSCPSTVLVSDGASSATKLGDAGAMALAAVMLHARGLNPETSDDDPDSNTNDPNSSNNNDDRDRSNPQSKHKCTSYVSSLSLSNHSIGSDGITALLGAIRRIEAVYAKESQALASRPTTMKVDGLLVNQGDILSMPCSKSRSGDPLSIGLRHLSIINNPIDTKGILAIADYIRGTPRPSQENTEGDDSRNSHGKRESNESRSGDRSSGDGKSAIRRSASSSSCLESLTIQNAGLVDTAAWQRLAEAIHSSSTLTDVVIVDTRGKTSKRSRMTRNKGVGDEIEDDDEHDDDDDDVYCANDCNALSIPNLNSTASFPSFLDYPLAMSLQSRQLLSMTVFRNRIRQPSIDAIAATYHSLFLRANATLSDMPLATYSLIRASQRQQPKMAHPHSSFRNPSPTTASSASALASPHAFLSRLIASLKDVLQYAGMTPPLPLFDLATPTSISSLSSSTTTFPPATLSASTSTNNTRVLPHHLPPSQLTLVMRPPLLTILASFPSAPSPTFTSPISSTSSPSCSLLSIPHRLLCASSSQPPALHVFSSSSSLFFRTLSYLPMTDAFHTLPQVCSLFLHLVHSIRFPPFATRVASHVIGYTEFPTTRTSPPSLLFPSSSSSSSLSPTWGHVTTINTSLSASSFVLLAPPQSLPSISTLPKAPTVSVTGRRLLPSASLILSPSSTHPRLSTKAIPPSLLVLNRGCTLRKALAVAAFNSRMPARGHENGKHNSGDVVQKRLKLVRGLIEHVKFCLEEEDDDRDQRALFGTVDENPAEEGKGSNERQSNHSLNHDHHARSLFPRRPNASAVDDMLMTLLGHPKQGNLSNVHTLDLSHLPSLLSETLARVLRCTPHLRSLSLASCPVVTDSILFTIASHCPSLQVLVLENTSVTDQGLSAVLASCTKLKAIDLSGCNHLSATALLYTKLSRTSNSSSTSSSVSSLVSSTSSIRAIRLAATPITASTLTSLATPRPSPSLTSFTFSPSSSSSLPPHSFPFPHLQLLDLRLCGPGVSMTILHRREKTRSEKATAKWTGQHGDDSTDKGGEDDDDDDDDEDANDEGDNDDEDTLIDIEGHKGKETSQANNIDEWVTQVVSGLGHEEKAWINAVRMFQMQRPSVRLLVD